MSCDHRIFDRISTIFGRSNLNLDEAHLQYVYSHSLCKDSKLYDNGFTQKCRGQSTGYQMLTDGRTDGWNGIKLYPSAKLVGWGFKTGNGQMLK